MKNITVFNRKKIFTIFCAFRGSSDDDGRRSAQSTPRLGRSRVRNRSQDTQRSFGSLGSMENYRVRQGEPLPPNGRKYEPVYKYECSEQSKLCRTFSWHVHDACGSDSLRNPFCSTSNLQKPQSNALFRYVLGNTGNNGFTDTAITMVTLITVSAPHGSASREWILNMLNTWLFKKFGFMCMYVVVMIHIPWNEIMYSIFYRVLN